MDAEIFISIYLDTRRSKASGKYPVKLRLFTKRPRKQKLYSTRFEFTQKEFDSVWNTTRPRDEWKEARLELQSLELRANEAAKKLHPFSFLRFETEMFQSAGDTDNVFAYFERAVNRLKSEERMSTGIVYENTAKSLKRFLEHQKSRAGKLSFYDITPEWLSAYERFMINNLEKTSTTIGMYLRNLRTIFNAAIHDDKSIPETIYPFGKNKYQIPSGVGVKKALNRDSLALFWKAKVASQEQQRAKDFWFLIYSLNGINITDLLSLKNKDIQGTEIRFIRQKTKLTSKTRQKLITVYLSPFAKEIIEKYRNKSSAANDYVFPFLKDMDAEQRYHQIRLFTRSINQALKKIAKANDLPEGISSYWARHSFATNAVRSGASMEQVGEALGHSSLKVTQGYFAGFEDNARKELAEKLLDFIAK